MEQIDKSSKTSLLFAFTKLWAATIYRHSNFKMPLKPTEELIYLTKAFCNALKLPGFKIQSFF